jgi:hypothetical protein
VRHVQFYRAEPRAGIVSRLRLPSHTVCQKNQAGPTRRSSAVHMEDGAGRRAILGVIGQRVGEREEKRRDKPRSD